MAPVGAISIVVAVVVLVVVVVTFPLVHWRRRGTDVTSGGLISLARGRCLGLGGTVRSRRS